ncbi:hypothetical protein VXS03_14005 [Photobacterium sp. S4TG1]|uniref:hypothetical protein n=1 Tax=Photobacterium sp. S4TG1 TaxID=3114587 RepID=UPI002E189088|nr:hypothetical protein [Photobacterium sp. S4TG1]
MDNDAREMAFFKARYEYSQSLFEKVVVAKNANEKKVVFISGFMTAVVIATIFKISDIVKYSDVKLMPWPVYILAAICLIFIVLCYLSLIMSMIVRKWDPAISNDATSLLFLPSSKILSSTSQEKAFYEEVALLYTLAYENNLVTNKEMSQKVSGSYCFLFLSVFSILLLIVVYSYYLL